MRQGKLVARVVKCMFMGYSEGVKGCAYGVLSQDSGSVSLERHLQ